MTTDLIARRLAGVGTGWRGVVAGLAVTAAVAGMAFLPTIVNAQIDPQTMPVQTGEVRELPFQDGGSARIDLSPLPGWQLVPVASRTDLLVRRPGAGLSIEVVSGVNDIGVAFDRRMRSISLQDGWQGGTRAGQLRTEHGLDGVVGTFTIDGRPGVLWVAGREGRAVVLSLTASEGLTAAADEVQRLLDRVEVQP